MGGAKGWRVGIGLAVGISWPAWGGAARARIAVSARVVRGARIEVPLRVQGRAASRRVPGGTEWRVEVAAPAAALALLGGCPGVRLREDEARSERAVWVFIPEGTRCTPVLRATVFPDAAP